MQQWTTRRHPKIPYLKKVLTKSANMVKTLERVTLGVNKNPQIKSLTREMVVRCCRRAPLICAVR